MAGLDTNVSHPGAKPAGPSKPVRLPNPVWKMMGLPNIRLRLPSRNWMIFFTITGSWTAAVLYDRREKKCVQNKWKRTVEHIAQETIPTHQLPRKLIVFLAAPPADGLVPARDHFNEYVQPILVAAALDWDAIEGRKEGDIRAGLAERIRKLRKKRGEASAEPVEEDVQELLEAIRERSGTRDWDGPGGDIVIGRHTWKEYVRGLHEGWLGPIDSPATNAPGEIPLITTPVAQESSPDLPAAVADVTTTLTITDDTSATRNTEFLSGNEESKKGEEAQQQKEQEVKSKKKRQTPPFISINEYESASLAQSCPQALGPVSVVPFPHLLGFFNFPIRMYRFLNRRSTADSVGRETAAAVLGVYRSFETTGERYSINAGAEDDVTQCEQQRLLKHEEPDWHKTARVREEGDDKERVWIESIVLDPRIAERMRKFVLEREVEDRANKLTLNKQKSWFSSWRTKEKSKGAWEGLTDDE